MSRDFTKNTSNLMELGTNAIGPLLHGASAISLHCWILMGSNSDGNFDNIIFQAGVGAAEKAITFNLDGPSNFGGLRSLFCSSAAASEDRQSAGASTVNSGSWQSVGTVVDFPAANIKLYLNGSVDANTTVSAFANSTYVHTTATGCTDRIGCGFATSPSTNNQVNGRIAEFAIWNVDIGAAGFLSLAAGFAPTLIAPLNSLAVYLRLLGNYSPEIDIRNSKTATITGTIAKADHPRIILPKRRLSLMPAVAEGSSGAVRQAMHQYRLRAG